MKKTISLFQRNYDGNRLVHNEVVPGAEWVLAGEGVATRKHDGTCCLVRDGKLWRRYDARQGKTSPSGFEPAQAPDPVSGHWPGWLPVMESSEDRWHREAWDNAGNHLPDGTYELCGPKVQGNPERLERHVLLRHGCEPLPEAPREFATLKAWLATRDIEGIVWHHADGRMVKIKARDFGLRRGAFTDSN